MGATNPIAASPNRLKLGVFGLNVSSGCAMTSAPDTLRIEWAESLRIARAAEAAGIEALVPVARWRGFGGATNFNHRSFETLTWAAGLAAATERIGIFATVHVPTVHPVRAAKEIATIDHISGGRFALNIVAGWNEPEYQAFGLPFDHRVDRFEEALQILGPLLREGHVDFAGQYYQARNCDIVPRGPRKEGPPLLVGSEGPRMLKLTAQYADLWNTGYMGKPETMAEPLAKFEAACRETGRDRATVGITALIGLWFPDLQAKQPSFFPHPLTGTAQEIAAAMRGYAELGVQHIMFQCEPYTAESRKLLTEALQLYRGTEQQ